LFAHFNLEEFVTQNRVLVLNEFELLVFVVAVHDRFGGEDAGVFAMGKHAF